MRVIAETAIASRDYGVWSEGEEFELYDPVAIGWIAARFVRPARPVVEAATSPRHDKAEKAVRARPIR